MEISKRQFSDVEVCRHFIPEQYKDIPITNSDIERFLASSERGTEKYNPYQGVNDGFEALSLGKSRRGLHIDFWEQSVLEGSIPYCTLLEDLSRPVVEYMKREMFKGADADLIEKAYAR